jgi:hypothetical protein
MTVDNMKVENWTFGPNNVLTYETDAGHSAWLQFVHLANGPIILGKFRELETEVLESEPSFLSAQQAVSKVSRMISCIEQSPAAKHCKSSICLYLYFSP